MTKKILQYILVAVHYIEIIIAILLTIGIGALVVGMVPMIVDLFTLSPAVNDFKEVLSYAFSLIIGVEFVKMVCKPTAENVIEVLMFAMARLLIIEHSSTWTSLGGIIAIALLFAIKKFLFTDVHEDN